MKIEIPVKVFRVAGKYYLAVYKKSHGYTIADVQGSPFSSEGAAKKQLLDIVASVLDDIGRPKLLPEFRKLSRKGKKAKDEG